MLGDNFRFSFYEFIQIQLKIRIWSVEEKTKNKIINFLEKRKFEFLIFWGANARRIFDKTSVRIIIWREIYCKETKMCGHFNDITLKLWHNTKTNMTFSEKSQTQVQSILDRCRLQWLKLFHPDQLWILSCFMDFRWNL